MQFIESKGSGDELTQRRPSVYPFQETVAGDEIIGEGRRIRQLLTISGMLRGKFSVVRCQVGIVRLRLVKGIAQNALQLVQNCCEGLLAQKSLQHVRPLDAQSHPAPVNQSTAGGRVQLSNWMIRQIELMLDIHAREAPGYQATPGGSTSY